MRPLICAWMVLLMAQVAAAMTAVPSAVLPQGRFGAAAVAVGDAIYVFGGFAEDGPAKTIERLGPERTTFETVGTMLNPRYWLDAATDGKIVYLVGGTVAGEERPQLVESFESWDPATGAWQSLWPLPEPRAHVGLVWLNGKLYAVGGSGLEGRSARLDIYDPATGTWSRGADLPVAREGDAVVHEGKIYMAGGYDGNNSLDLFAAYDPATDQWETLPPMPFVLSAHHGAVVDGQLYTFGHYSKPGRVTAYDFSVGKWQVLENLGFTPARHNAVVFDGESVWVIGGNTNASPPYSALAQSFPRDQLRVAPRRPVDQDEIAERVAARPFVLDDVTTAALDEWVTRLEAIKTLELEMEQLTRYTGLDFTPDAMEYAVTLDRTGRRLHYKHAYGETILDGETMTSVRPQRRRYFVRPQIEEAGFGLPGDMQYFHKMQPDLLALSAENPGSQLLQEAMKNRWQLDPEGASEVWTFDGIAPLFSGGPTAVHRFEIDRTTGLLRAYTYQIEQQMTMNGVETNSLVVTTTKAVSVKVNEPLSDAAFVFKPEPGWRKVDSLEELDARPDRSRFALSGKPAPDFSFTLLDGSLFTLSDHTGKVVILDFWATWCGPCVSALPYMEEFYQAIKTQEVVVVGISSDDPENEQKVRDMVAQKDLTYLVGIDTNGIGRSSYFVQGIPCVVMINQQGIVQGRKVGFSPELAEQLGEATRKMLAGETLPSAVPPTEDDLEELAPTRAPIRVDARVFETIWEKDAGSDANPDTRNVYRLGLISMTQPWMVVEDATGLVVYATSSGEVIHTFAYPPSSPPSATNIIFRDSWTALRRSGTSPLFVRFRQVAEIEYRGSSRYSKTLETELTAFDQDGVVLWTNEEKDVGQDTLQSLPMGPDEDALLLGGYSGFRLIGHDGRLIARQFVRYPSRYYFMDADDDAWPELYLNGTRSGAYRIRR